MRCRSCQTENRLDGLQNPGYTRPRISVTDTHMARLEPAPTWLRSGNGIAGPGTARTTGAPAGSVHAPIAGRPPADPDRPDEEIHECWRHEDAEDGWATDDVLIAVVLVVSLAVIVAVVWCGVSIALAADIGTARSSLHVVAAVSGSARDWLRHAA